MVFSTPPPPIFVCTEIHHFVSVSGYRGMSGQLGTGLLSQPLVRGERVSLAETTLKEDTVGVWGKQTLEARGRGPLRMYLPKLPQGLS